MPHYNYLIFMYVQEENKELNLNKMELQNDNKNLTDKTIMLEMSVSEKNQELEEMRNTLDYKSNDLKSAMKLIEVCMLTLFYYLIINLY